MGNTKSTQSSKTGRDRKKEGHGSADTRKGGRPASGTGKTAGQKLRDFDGNHVRVHATNPFIIFFLRLRTKKPKEPVTVIARAAGKLWSQMTPEQKKEYVDLANAEKKRRQERKRKRKRLSARSRTK